MCGIFGMVRNVNAAHAEKASAVLIELGRLSVERGRDSAGLAFIPRTEFAASQVHEATKDQASSPVANFDGVIVAKATSTFDQFWNDDEYLQALTASQVVIGHTRAATQGNRRKLENSSPLAVGYVVGTHNGDLEPNSVPKHYNYRKDMFGATDTEYLYRAINETGSHRKKISDILTAINGRAALAWIDRRATDRFFLARASLSPMAIAYDAEGNFYWASNPNWFRIIDEKFGNTIGFNNISMVQEGSLLTIDFGTGEAIISDLRTFRPTARFSDSMLSDGIVWRNFTKDDEKADKDQTQHLVADRPVSTYTKAANSYSTGGNWYNNNRPVGGPAFSNAGSEDTYVSQIDALAEEEAIYSSGTYDDLGHDVIEEVQEAVIQWAEEGMNVNVYLACSEAKTEADFERMMKDFHLSSVEAAKQFAQEIVNWQEENEIESRAAVLRGFDEFEEVADDYDRQVALNEAASC